MRKLWVRKLDPIGLHGFRAGELVLDDLQPGLNLVVARNAAGKSTLAKAMGLLFDPSKCEKEQLVLGVVDGWEGQQHLQAKRKGGRYPGFPGESDQYQLNLLSLIEGFKPGQSPLDEEIGEGMKFTPAPAVGMQKLGEVTVAKEARRRLLEARRDKESVVAVEDQIPALERRVEEARRGRRIAESLEAFEAVSRAKARVSELKAIAREFETLTPGLELQTQDAVGVAQTLLKTVQGALDRFADAQAALRRVRPAGERPVKPLSLATRNALSDLRTESLALEAELVSAQRGWKEEAGKAKVARNQVLQLLPDEDQADFPIPKIQDFDSLIAAAAQADAARSAQAQTEAYRAMSEDWRKQHPDADPAAERKTQRLIDWLSALSQAIPDRRPPAFIALVAIFAAAQLLLPSVALRFVAAVLAVILSLVLFFFRLPKGKTKPPDLSDLISGDVTVERAAEHLAALSRRVANQQVQAELEAKSKVLAPSLEWNQISESLRLKCQNPYALAPLATSLSSYHTAVISAAASQERLALLQTELDSKRESIREILAKFSFPAEGVSEIACADAFIQWFDMDEELGKAETEALAAESALKRFCAENGVRECEDVDGALAELTRRSPAAERLSAATKEIEKLEYLVSDRRFDADLVRLGLGDELDSSTPAEIAAAREQFELMGADLQERQQDLSNARATIQTAERASIPEREQAYEHALSNVELRFEQLVRQAVRARIGQEIQERLRTTELPEVVRRASGYLESFTDSRFRLEIGTNRSDGLGMLMVRDRERNLQAFSELSTGTKVHSVIAIRLAVIAAQEDNAAHGADPIRFPLVADEALAVSDPECSREIAHTLAAIAQERQVIVFSNDPAEADLFRSFDPHLNLLTLGSPELSPAHPRRPRKSTPIQSECALTPQLALDV